MPRRYYVIISNEREKKPSKRKNSYEILIPWQALPERASRTKKKERVFFFSYGALRGNLENSKKIHQIIQDAKIYRR